MKFFMVVSLVIVLLMLLNSLNKVFDENSSVKTRIGELCVAVYSVCMVIGCILMWRSL